MSVERHLLVFQCEEGLVPQETVMATCQPDGTWNPDPLNYSCDSHTTTEDIGTNESNHTTGTTIILCEYINRGNTDILVKMEQVS